MMTMTRKCTTEHMGKKSQSLKSHHLAILECNYLLNEVNIYKQSDICYRLKIKANAGKDERPKSKKKLSAEEA